MEEAHETALKENTTDRRASLLCGSRHGATKHGATKRLVIDEGILSIDGLLCCRCLIETRNSITQSEYEVASQVVMGRAYKEVALLRGVSIETVKTQINCVFKKTDTCNRIELLMLVLETNIRELKRHVEKNRMGYT